MDLADVVDQVRRRGGVMRRSRLPRRAVEQALAHQLLVAPRRGIVADPELPEAVLAALRAGGVLSCGSAAQAFDLPLIDRPERVHVTVPRNRPAHVPLGVVVHRRDVPSLDGCTTLSQTGADCARCLDQLNALAVLDGVLNRGVEPAAVASHLHGPGSPRALGLLARANGEAGSSGETCARIALEDAGLRVEPQVFFSDVGWVDLLVEGRIVVEIDGFGYHGDVGQFARDRRRDAVLVSMGLLVLRFTWADAVRRPGYVVAMVRAALAVAR